MSKLISLIILLYQPVYCAFEENGNSARVLSMGNAFVGLADDITAIYYNPSGLAKLKTQQFFANYSKLYINLDDNSLLSKSFIGYLLPTKFGNFALAINNFSLTGVYQENSYFGSYSRKILERLDIGINAKIFEIKIAKFDDSLNNEFFKNYGFNKTAVSGDLGLIYQLNKNYNIGFSILDLNSPDIAFNPLDKVKISPSIKVGFGFKSIEKSPLNFDIDLTRKGKNNTIAVGFEKYLFESFGLRGGLGFGNNDFKNISFGASYKIKNLLEIFYGFNLPLTIKDTYGSHHTGIKILFGKQDDSEESKLIKQLQSKIQELELQLDNKKEEGGTTEKIQPIQKMKEYYYKGLQYYKNGEYQDAILEFEKILKINPTHPQSLRLIERCKKELKK